MTMKLSRRHVAGASLVGAAVVASSRFAPALAQAARPPLRAVVTIAGVRHEYREDQGRSLGDFTSSIGNFIQACIRVDVAGSPLTVFFRPDKTSDRVEVVFELGRVFNATPVNLGAYSVVILRGETVLASVDVPEHYWFSRWRWQSAPRPVMGDVGEYIKYNLLPPYDRAGALATLAAAVGTVTTAVTGCTPTTAPEIASTAAPGTPYKIMGTAGLVAYMPTTGERPDIGMLTEPQAEYVCTARQTALETLRAQAEAAGTVPWHIRDEQTSAPLNLKQYPKASWYPGNNTGLMEVKTIKTPIVIDSAHQPALAYLPYLLTGDPYHLEDLQFQATYNLGVIVPTYRLSIPQPRTFAWNLRTLAQCANITPQSVPSWLLPKSYFVGWLAETRMFFENEYVNSLRPERQRFRTTRNIDASGDEGATAPKGTWSDPWEDEFVASVLGWVVSMGFSDWRSSFNWIIGSTFARTGTSSGWVRAHATPYRMVLRATATSPVAGSWSEAWTLARTINKLAYTDANTWVNQDMMYLAYSRGALVYADKLQASATNENLNWTTSQFNTRKWKVPFKWRLGTGLTT